MADLAVRLGTLKLKNPVLVGSCEATMDAAGIQACLDAGAGAVVAKSVNESPAARRQLRAARYVVLDEHHRPAETSAGVSLFNRSGLADVDIEPWLAILEAADRRAREAGAWVIGSVTAAGAEAAGAILGRMSEVVRAVELNVGAPHGREASAVSRLTAPEAVAAYVGQARASLRAGTTLIVKLGQADDLVGMALAAEAAGADVVAMVGRFNGFVPDLETWDPVLGTAAAIGGGWALPVTCYWLAKTWRERPALPLIGTNGARSGEDVARMLLSGAGAAELATLVYTRGATAISGVLDELDAYCERKACRAQDLVGVAASRMLTYAEVEQR